MFSRLLVELLVQKCVGQEEEVSRVLTTLERA